MKEDRRSANARSCVIFCVAKHPPMRETMLHAKTFCRCTPPVKTHEYLFPTGAALYTQRIVDTVPQIPFLIKIANHSKSCIALPKGTKFASYVASPQSCFMCESKEHGPDTLGFVQLYNASRCKERITAPTPRHQAAGC